MKLLILTAVKTYEKEAIGLFKTAQINAFSSADINGFKTEDHENLIDNWFSSSSDKMRSLMFFSFTDEKKIDQLLIELEKLNKNLSESNPIRAIVLNIEKFL